MFILRLALFLFLSTVLSFAHAQRPGGRPQGPPIGRVYGKVLDASTHKGAEYATVSLLAAGTDSLVSGTLVRGNGDFELEELRAGTYVLRISFIGHTTQDLAISITQEKPVLDVGNLNIEPDAELLKEVEVVGEKNSMVMKVDRRVYKVEKDISSKGGSAEDVMRNIPGLSVDVDGNVTMRNAAPQILIDGRPTTMTLDQIRSEEIDRVEVITNPSVAFDANTTGGLINVVLKKNEKPGYSGSIQGGIGTNERYQGSGNLQVKEGRTNVNLSYNLNTSKNYTKSYTHRTDLLDGATVGYFDQDGNTTSKRGGQGGRFSIDHDLDNRNQINFDYNIRTRKYDSQDAQVFSVRDGSSVTTSTGTQTNTSVSDGNDMTGRLGFRRKGPEEDKLFTVDVTYNRSRRTSDASFVADAQDENGLPDPANTFTQENSGNNDNDQITFQADMADPMGDRNKLEYGVKVSMANKRSLLEVYDLDPDNNTPVFNDVLSNDYRISDNIGAAYVNWSHMFNERWSMQGGVRYEETRFTGTLEGKDTSFVYAYPKNGQDLDKALFPAIYLVRRWGDEGDREMQFNISRKISRPNFWQLYPFISYRDSRSYRIGNPSLAPEVSTLAETNHLLPFKDSKGSWFSSFFGRYTEDVITNYTFSSPDDPEILVNTYVNGNDSWTLGWENSIRYKFSTAVDVTLSGTAEYTQVAAFQNSNNAGWSGETKGQVSWKMPKDFTFQANGEYSFPRIVPQGTTLANYQLNLSMSKDIKREWSFVLSLSDVFNSQRWGTNTSSDTFIMENSRRRQQRNLRFTVTWRFGERDVSIFRRTRTQHGREPGMDGGDGDL